MANTSNPCNVGTEQRTGHQPQTGTREAAGGRMGAHQGQAENLSSTMSQKAGEAWETTKEGVQSAASSVASVTENTWDELSSFIRRHPWACLAVGCGAGYLAIRSLGSEASLSGSWSRSPQGSMGYRSSPSWRGEECVQPRNQGSTSAMTERAGEAWESAKQGAQYLASTVASGVTSGTSQAMDRISDWSREYPLATPSTGLLIGACCGFLAGWAFGCQTSSWR
jgi:ElaB/YqjD/DUF883 family membrane-anchored ribosome-binding protein